MHPKCFVLLLAGLFAFSPVVRAQIQGGGSVDLEYRNGGLNELHDDVLALQLSVLF